MHIPPLIHRTAPWLCAGFSGLLMALCFAPWEKAGLVWIALLPLIGAVWAFPSPGWKAPLLGYCSGLVFFTATFSWLSALAPLFASPALAGLPLLLASYLSLYPALWAWLIRLAPKPRASALRTSLAHIGFAARGAGAWVALDWLRGWLFTGFGWNTPGIALHQNLALIQIADLFGVHGITFLVVFANLSFALVLRRIVRERSIRSLPTVRIELMAVILMVAASLSYGARFLLHPLRDTLSLQTASLQPNQPQETLFDPAGDEAVFASLDRLMQFVGALNPAPQLVLWPEAATPRGILADEPSRDFLWKQARRTPAALLIGSVEETPAPTPGELQTHNSALLLNPQATTLQSYRKRHLVPFGEFLPFRDWLPKTIRDLVPGDLAPGTDASLLHLAEPAIALGALVCFEDSLARETSTLALQGAQMLVNLTNDAWFGNSAGAAQHLANARFRAIETRLPLLRCANTGVTCAIDPSGRISQRIPPFTEGVDTQKVAVPRSPQPTPYTRWGDRWVWIGALCALRLALPTRQPPSPKTDSSR
ncbi:MAG: hypothetical protein RLZZ399_2286 [Verrucomicrobiota bacterium]|jgi:apolipoprotein N-acyltransferase